MSKKLAIILAVALLGVGFWAGSSYARPADRPASPPASLTAPSRPSNGHALAQDLSQAFEQTDLLGAHRAPPGGAGRAGRPPR
jgi:hypothetical protein